MGVQHNILHQPTQKVIDAIEPIYSEMLKVEQQAGAKDASGVSLH